MFKTIAIHGRQPALGRTELESLYGASCLVPFGQTASLLTIAPDAIDFDRLGGSVRIARILSELPSEWNKIETHLIAKAPEHADTVDGKLSFGISVFGIDISSRRLAKTAFLVKKAIRSSGHSVRMVPHEKTELNSATVLYNKLTQKNGWELLVVSDGKNTYLAQTVRIQDIDAYTARDRARPHRDAKVGMLPPKLAQIIINLATAQSGNTAGSTSDGKRDGTGTEVSSAASSQADPLLVLDPFCGTGVVLQEAMLMDFDIYGTDLEPRMVQYTIDNLSWLDTLYPEKGDYRRIEIGDATRHRWEIPKHEAQNSKLAVACETYLGKPLSALPPSDQLAKIMHEVNALHHKFLQNIGSQIPAGTRLCLAVPTWRGRHEFLHLSVLDYLQDLGYNRVKFEHVSNENLIYYREGQVVGRELLVLIKK